MTDYPNWFKQTALEPFKSHLLPLAGQKLRALQIGAYTGDASVWLLENVLTHEDSKLFDVDTWEGSDELLHKGFDWSDVEKTYDEKVAPYAGKVFKHKENSTIFLANYTPPRFDFIYVDGDHTALGVFLDAMLGWVWLNEGGIMAFDDYTWGTDEMNKHLTPKLGIDTFAYLYAPEIKVLELGQQVWLQRIAVA
jgi:predicted O-methyltransferase YrrM